MRRALRRAGWALAAAGGIGIAAPAGAQTQVVQIIGPGGHVEQPAGEVIVMTEAQAHFEEGQVELGLLSDPMLFSYGLGAHVQGVNVEVRGFVPNEVIRDQALKVAREQSALHVLDKLKIAPNLATRYSVDKPEHIQRAAKELIEDAFPAHGRGIDVKCDARGRVTVTGLIGSFEDRLLLSRKLRQVPGCSCVVNQLAVAGAEPPARSMETTHTALVPDAPPITTRPVLVPVVPDAPPITTRPAVRKSGKRRRRWSARTVAVPPHTEPDVPSPGMPRTDTGSVARPSVPWHAATPTPAKEMDPPTLAMPRVYQDPPALPPAPAPVPAVKPVPSPRVSVPSIDKDWPHSSGTAGAPALDQSLVEHASPAPKLPADHLPPSPAPKLPLVVNEPAPAAPKPPPLPPIAQPAPSKTLVLPPVPPLPKLPAIDTHKGGGSEESYVSEGTITIDEDPLPTKPIATKAPAPLVTVPPLPPVPPVSPAKAPPSTVKPAEGTMTLTPPPLPPSRSATDPMKLSAPPAKPPAPPPPARPNVSSAVRLKERIQGVVSAGYEVKVTPRGKNTLLLEVTGRVAGEDRLIMKQITPVVQSEEFRGIEVNIDVMTPYK